MRPFLQSSLDRIYLLLGCRITRRKQCELEYLVGWILITQAAVLHAGIISSQMFQRWKQMCLVTSGLFGLTTAVLYSRASCVFEGGSLIK